MLNNANLALILSLLADRANPQGNINTITQHYEITQGADGSTTVKITIESKPQQAQVQQEAPQAENAQEANLSPYHAQASQPQGQTLTSEPQGQAVGLSQSFTPFNVLAVDYEQGTIYGHSTDGIKALMGAVKRFWTNHDPKEADTIANKDEIAEWIRENYSVSKSQAMEIQRIIRPQEAQHLGRRF